MRVVNEDEVQLRLPQYVRELNSALFIYPTDTVYGIGCNATDEALVARLRELKGQQRRPISVIVPSKEWIVEHCVITPHAKKWLDRLPGPLTLILKLKDPDHIAWNVTMGCDTIGVRIPDSWIADVVKELGHPIVTTSANLQGGDVMVSLEDLHPQLKNGVDLVIYSGPISGSPSTLVKLDGEKAVIQAR